MKTRNAPLNYPGNPYSSSTIIKYVNTISLLVLVFFGSLFSSCHHAETSADFTTGSKALTKCRKDVIDIVPYTGMPVKLNAYVYERLRKIFQQVNLCKPVPLPKAAYYQPRCRYRADSLIRFQTSRTREGHVTLGLTSKDISVTKGSYADFGIMGLSYCPGKAAVCSIYRLHALNLKEQLFKLIVHELGHSFGLPHCPVPTCFMRDAKGRNHFNEERDFCPKCMNVLLKAGWKI
jgi:archaemetzincin